jgi:large subunit ribosomal protein L31
MKKNTHPAYGDARARCVCGNAFTLRSTKLDISVERCSHCHPVYTGVQLSVDAEGRVERFKRRYART